MAKEDELLTEEEIQEWLKDEECRGYPIQSGWVTPEIMEHIKDVVRAQFAKDNLPDSVIRRGEKKKTCKEVGEYLEKMKKGGHLNREVIEYLIEALKQEGVPK